MELLDLSKCKTNEEVSNLIRERTKEFGVHKLISNLRDRFIYHEEATRRIFTALATGKNAILHGPGGFGKSVLVKAICVELGIPIICKVGYKGMQPEQLLGVPNMTELLEKSKYVTAFENSVFSKPGILLLEEFFDADPSTAAALKDVLTERGFREGDISKESMISSVIICGNKTPEDVSVDDSTSAFYLERFPYRQEMVWKSFTEKDYLEFFKVYYGKIVFKEKSKELLLVAKLCAGTEERVSPRVASQAADTAIEMGVEFLDTITAIDTSMITEMKEQVNKQARLLDETALLEHVQSGLITIIDDLRTATLTTAIEYRVALQEAMVKLKEQNFSDDSMQLYTEVLTLLSHGLHSCDTILEESVDLEVVNDVINSMFND